MAEPSRSLWVAIAAAGLLVVVVSVDAAITRTVSLDVRTDEDGPDAQNWQRLAATGEEPYRFDRGEVVVQANRTDQFVFRLTVDNEPPWAFEEAYRLRSGGTLLGSGTIEAPGGSTATAEVEVTADRLIDANQGPRPGPSPAGVHVEASVGSETLFGFLSIEEVPR